MRRSLAALAATGVLLALPAVAHAQEDTTPTTLEVETSTVERPVQTVVSEEVAADVDDDSDNTGLWGLLGLLGLVGLVGLKRPVVDRLGPRTGAVAADTTPRGATRSDT